MSNQNLNQNNDSNHTGWEKIGVAVALSRSYNADQTDFLRSLAELLQAAVPEFTTVERKKKHLFGSETMVVGVSVALDDDIYSLEQPQANMPLRARRQKIVRGITLKTDSIPVSQWLHLLSDVLEERAKESEEAAMAMRTFLEIGAM